MMYPTLCRRLILLVPFSVSSSGGRSAAAAKTASKAAKLLPSDVGFRRCLSLYNRRMARYTLVYGIRLIPEGSLKAIEEAKLTLADGSTAGLTLHTIDGTIPQLRRALDRSLDAFFDLLPGADKEDLEEFAD
jgi:hypothetical protein